jgi:hypothetical protein
MKWIRIPATSTSVPTNAYQLAPRNAQTVLYASGEKIATMFIDMWKRIKSTRKQPVMLITNFLPREELVRKQPIMFEICLFLLKICLRFGKDSHCLHNNNTKQFEIYA